MAALAGAQHGVVSTRQLVRLGLTKDAILSAVRDGRLHRLHRGVYAVGHLALTLRSSDIAAVLACGPDALLSHRSAGGLWQFRRARFRLIEVTVPRTRTARKGILLHRSRLVHPDDRAIFDGIPVTSPARTIVDLAEVLDDARFEAAVNEAEVRRLFDLAARARWPRPRDLTEEAKG